MEGPCGSMLPLGRGCQAALHGWGAWGTLIFQSQSRREEENKLLLPSSPWHQHPRAPRPTCPALQEPAEGREAEEGAREPCLPLSPAFLLCQRLPGCLAGSKLCPLCPLQNRPLPAAGDTGRAMG